MFERQSETRESVWDRPDEGVAQGNHDNAADLASPGFSPWTPAPDNAPPLSSAAVNELFGFYADPSPAAAPGPDPIQSNALGQPVGGDVEPIGIEADVLADSAGTSDPIARPGARSSRSGGQEWDGVAVASAVAALTTIPPELEIAIRQGPDAVAAFCATRVIPRIQKFELAKPGTHDYRAKVTEMEALVTALAAEQAGSPDRYPEIANAARYHAQFAPGVLYRDAAIKSMDSWKGAVEGEKDGKFARFRSSDALETNRKAAGAIDRTYTTCVDFAGQVQADARTDSKTKQAVSINVMSLSPENLKKLKALGAWQEATPGMNERPRPGDVYYLGAGTSAAYEFHHMGFVRAVNRGATPETWTTVDGGAGTPGKYDKEGNKTQQGKEKIAEGETTYDPATCTLGTRRLLGWVDVEKVATD